MADSKDVISVKFKELLYTYNKDLGEIKAQIRRTSILRIAVFLLTIVGIYIASTFGWVPLVLSVIVQEFH